MRKIVGASIVIGVAAAGLVAPVCAADDILISKPHRDLVSRFYIGADIGYASYQEMDDGSAGFSLYGGYNLNEVLAIDLGWTDLGDVTGDSKDAEVSALYLDIMGRFPLQTDLTLFGKVGLASWDYEATQGAATDSDSDIDVYFGIGMDYDVSGSSAVRFSADFFSIKPELFNVKQDDENLIFFSIGYVYKL